MRARGKLSHFVFQWMTFPLLQGRIWWLITCWVLYWGKSSQQEHAVNWHGLENNLLVWKTKCYLECKTNLYVFNCAACYLIAFQSNLNSKTMKCKTKFEYIKREKKKKSNQCFDRPKFVIHKLYKMYTYNTQVTSQPGLIFMINVLVYYSTKNL